MPAPTRYAVDQTDLELGYYVIEASDDGAQFRWKWAEISDGDLFTEHGSWVDTRSSALREAGDNWNATGSGGRLGATLRASAARIENAAT